MEILALEDLSFRYPGCTENAVDGVSLTVREGEFLLLCGRSGCGKTTLLKLIKRELAPQGELSGNILFRSRPLDSLTDRESAQKIGYVLQSPHLFSGTVADNIRYGKPEATDEEVRRAAQMVNAEGFILKMENGYDTQVGEGGNRLSTGQKQLISFARAILCNPALFVLDEATSSVDTETEQIIQHAIQTVLAGRTSFIIAHRLSTVRSADRILVIQHGKITEDGTHQQLIAKRGYYYQLYTNQFQEERGLDILAGNA